MTIRVIWSSVDDPRLEVVWETAGELGMPVLVHVADPVAFFDPIDETNERWEEPASTPIGLLPARLTRRFFTSWKRSTAW